MRDLARQNLITRKKHILSIPAFKFISIAVLVVVILVVAKNVTSGGGIVTSADSAVHDAPNNLTPVSLESSTLDISDSGVQLDSDSITLTAVSGLGGSGNARRTFGGGSFSLSVSATLPDPKGNKYQVWITNGTNIKDAGFMTGSKTSWSLTFRDNKNYSNYREIWITQEITTEDAKPETHRLEGNF